MPNGSKLGYPKEEKKKKELILGKIVDEIRKVIKGRIREKVLIQKGDYRQYKPLSNSNWDHPSKNKTELGEISSKVKNKIKDIMKYDHIDDLADYIEQFDIDKSKWRVISHYFDDIRDENMGIKPSGYADRSRKELEKILFKVIKEAAKPRDYKAEYKKYQSSTKSKKYRAELNKYNRQKGTYGNGDGKDASHKNGKIVGFEAESKNRGRAEKSRLKKEGMNKSQAEELLNQLGGNRFKAMVGAKDFGIGSDGLHFKIGRNSKSISHIVIRLTSMDVYEMKFLRVRAGKITVVKKVNNVYADMLGKIFKKYTGMNVRL